MLPVAVPQREQAHRFPGVRDDGPEPAKLLLVMAEVSVAEEGLPSPTQSKKQNRFYSHRLGGGGAYGSRAPLSEYEAEARSRKGAGARRVFRQRTDCDARYERQAPKRIRSAVAIPPSAHPAFGRLMHPPGSAAAPRRRGA